MKSGLHLIVNQFKRELLIQRRQVRLWINSCLFFLMILLIFPLTLRPEPELMRTIAPGLVWVAALLSTLLSSERMFQQDAEEGVIEQWLISGHSVYLMIGAKVFAHWLFNLIPFLLLTPLIAMLFSFNAHETVVLVISFICGSPALFFLCALAASFGIGIHQKGALMALILLPLTLPVIIFGSGMVSIALQGLPIIGYSALLVAMSLIAVGFLPFAIGGVIRVLHAD